MSFFFIIWFFITRPVVIIMIIVVAVGDLAYDHRCRNRSICWMVIPRSCFFKVAVVIILSPWIS